MVDVLNHWLLCFHHHADVVVLSMCVCGWLWQVSGGTTNVGAGTVDVGLVVHPSFVSAQQISSFILLLVMVMVMVMVSML